jgi:catechol 2,3-dioxygenase-like lactoylglutathione lyase family enzyme
MLLLLDAAPGSTRMRLNHLHLHVQDVNRSRAFYEHYFGMKQNAMQGDILFMRDEGGMDLALASASEPAEMPDWFHFGFRLVSAKAVEEMHEKMMRGRLPSVGEIERELGYVTFRCTDPDGYSIEVYWED